jgi:hypothetical protein
MGDALVRCGAQRDEFHKAAQAVLRRQGSQREVQSESSTRSTKLFFSA